MANFNLRNKGANIFHSKNSNYSKKINDQYLVNFILFFRKQSKWYFVFWFIIMFPVSSNLIGLILIWFFLISALQLHVNCEEDKDT